MANLQKSSENGGKWAPAAEAIIDDVLETRESSDEFVVMDFDNTVFCGDIGESILPVAKQRGLITREQIEEYERKLTQTTHAPGDHSPFADAYSYGTEIFEGLTPKDMVDLTDAAIGKRTESDPHGELFYPRIVELIAALQKSGLSVKVVSASNVWSVRRMVTGYLNPIIEKEHGAPPIPLKNVVGVNVLLRNKEDGKIFSHSQLAGSDGAYNRMEAGSYSRYALTSRIAHPLPAYAGKVANIIQYFGERRPVLALGDSPNDIPLLKYARSRIWIARLAKRSYIEELVKIASDDRRPWVVQPASTEQPCRFVSPLEDQGAKDPALTEEEKGSLELLKTAKLL